MLEIFTGTKEEKTAIKTISRLHIKSRLTRRDEEALRDAKRITRRLFIRRIVVTGGGLVVASLGALSLPECAKEDSDEAVYNKYLQGFESLVDNDIEANKLLNFFKNRRKLGTIKYNLPIPQEPLDPQIHFYTAIVDPRRDKMVFDTLAGFAQYEHRSLSTYLLLKKVPIDGVWAGALLVHESLHIYQWLSGIEQSRHDGFMIGEQEAYDLEFRLLDNATVGKFKEILIQRAQDVRDGAYRGRLSSQDFYSLSSLFNKPLSQDEEGLRRAAYIVALNFTIAEMRASSKEEAKRAKVGYIRSVFEGRIPLLP